MQSKEPGFFAHLESLGVEKAESEMFSGAFGDVSDSSNWRIIAAKEFIESKRATRAEAKADRALEIAEEANFIARREARFAMYAAIIAMLAAIISTKEQILAFILGHP